MTAFKKGDGNIRVLRNGLVVAFIYKEHGEWVLLTKSTGRVALFGLLRDAKEEALKVTS